MANPPISSPLPADLPVNWGYGQTVAPSGTDVGLSQQHGYNYQSQQINDAQQAINTINSAFYELATTAAVANAIPQITFTNAYTTPAGVRKTAQLPTSLSVARQSLAATTVGNYALFGGGSTGSASAAVDAYEVNANYLLTLFVPAWYAYALNGAAETVVTTDTTLSLSNPTPFNGYLKPATKTYTGQI